MSTVIADPITSSLCLRIDGHEGGAFVSQVCLQCGFYTGRVFHTPWPPPFPLTTICPRCNMRPAVQWFAECMESRLAMNEARSSLPRPTREECLAAIDRNAKQAARLYASSLNYEPDDTERDAVVRDAVHAAADVANWLLMLLEINVNEKPDTRESLAAIDAHDLCKGE